MSQQQGRRRFLQASAASAGLGSLAHTSAQPGDDSNQPAPPDDKPKKVQDEFGGFSRYKPSRGNDPNDQYYIGKMVPGFRPAGDGPAPFHAPGTPKLPYKMKNGVKEFHLNPSTVSQEFLPGYKMNVYGYNGSTPGPVVEITQGDRVRFICKNLLPEPTFVHWHGFELQVQYDGASELCQNPIMPGETFVYEFDVHESGTFFYHSHVPMQEAIGMVGFIIVHPKTVFDPPVDRDLGLIFQNFMIEPNQDTANSWAMDWNWNTINGRSGPHSPPLVVKHGERVRIRIMNFSPMQHHPIHIHGHTFWITGHEGARIPHSAWVPRNTELIGIAQATDFEFIANNPGDWMFHCHMVHHMMNHMTEQVGPRMRKGRSVEAYLANLDRRPAPEVSPIAEGKMPKGYPQMMMGMKMSPEFMKAIWAPRETRGMRMEWPKAVAGLMTVLRVLPDDLYQKVMESDEEVKPGSIFEEIVRRFGNINTYHPSPKMEK